MIAIDSFTELQNGRKKKPRQFLEKGHEEKGWRHKFRLPRWLGRCCTSLELLISLHTLEQKEVLRFWFIRMISQFSLRFGGEKFLVKSRKGRVEIISILGDDKRKKKETFSCWFRLSRRLNKAKKGFSVWYWWLIVLTTNRKKYFNIVWADKQQKINWNWKIFGEWLEVSHKNYPLVWIISISPQLVRRHSQVLIHQSLSNWSDDLTER